jgi:hypothetical protein
MQDIVLVLGGNGAYIQLPQEPRIRREYFTVIKKVVQREKNK